MERKDDTSLEAKIISLPASVERRQSISDQMSRLPIKWSFFDALTSDSFSSISPDSKNQLKRFGRVLTEGEVGCYKSHFEVLSLFDKNQSLKWLLILEDDVYVDVDFDFVKLVDYADAKGVNYVRLYCRRWAPAEFIDNFGSRQFLRFKTDPYGTQAYLISRTGAAAFRASVKSIDMPIDDEYGQFWRHGLQIYAVFPFPVLERAIPSTLETARDAVTGDGTRRRWAHTVSRLDRFLRKHLENMRFKLTARRLSL